MEMQQVSDNCFAVLNEKNRVCDANSGMIILAGAGLTAFVLIERRQPVPLIPFAALRNRTTRASLLMNLLVSAAIFVRAGMQWGALLDAVAAAECEVLDPVRRGGELPRYNLVIDLVRNFGPEFALEQVEAIARARHPRVVGVTS